MKYLLLSITLLLSTVAIAQNDVDTQQAEVVTKLFMDSCLASLANNKEVSNWAKSNKLQPANDQFSKAVLQGQTGEVWGASNSIGQFLVVLSPPNQCSVWAKRANVAAVNNNFEKIVSGVARPGIVVAPAIDKISYGFGGKFRQFGFTITKEGATSGYMLLATTSESDQAEVQVRLTTSPVALTLHK